jgi:glycerol-3-phosphate O-acyltransferase/dihydroxyacetone phosphate acyltransferase
VHRNLPRRCRHSLMCLCALTDNVRVGGSHDRTDLLPLKAGVSLMALGAMASDPDCKVKIVPVGLSYFHAHKFRSRAVVEFGSAMDVPADLVAMFKEGGDQKRIATQKLLDTIYDALKTVTLRAPDYETLMVVQAARRLYNTPGQHLSLGQVVELNKRFLEGYMHFKEEPQIQALREKVLKYNRLIRDLGLRDHQVPRAQRASWKLFGLLMYRFMLLVLWTVFALPGVVINAPIFITAKVMSRKKAKGSIASSDDRRWLHSCTTQRHWRLRMSRSLHGTSWPPGKSSSRSRSPRLPMVYTRSSPPSSRAKWAPVWHGRS